MVKDYLMMMMVTVLAVHLFWIAPLCKAIRERPKLVMNVQNDADERSDDIDGGNNNEEASDSGV